MNIDERQPVEAIGNEGYEKLQVAIVSQALKDYEHWYEKGDTRISEVEMYLRKFPSGEIAMETIRKKVDDNRKIKIAKAILYRIRRLEKKYSDNLCDIEVIKMNATNTSPVQTDGSARTSVSDKVGQAGIRIADIKCENKLIKSELSDLRKSALRFAKLMSTEMYKLIIIEYYIECRKWSDVVDIVNSNLNLDYKSNGLRCNHLSKAVEEFANKIK